MSQCKQQPNDGQPQAGTCKNCGNCPSAKPQGEVVHPHIVVVGRMNGDDEDRAKTYTNLTAGQARHQFKSDVRKEEGIAESNADDHCRVYVNNIFASNSPINEVS